MATYVRRRPHLVGLTAALVLFGFASTDARADDTVIPSQVRQDTIVRMAGAAQYPGVSRVIPEITIDGSDLPAGGFGSFGDALWAVDGKFWVAEGGLVGPPMLYLFDSTGRFLKQVGRLGAGPGEYRAPRGLAQLPDGRILVRDARLTNRLNVYRPDGEYADTWTFASQLTTGPAVPRPDVDTAGFTWIEHFGAPSLTGPASGTGFVRVTRNGEIVDTVPFPRLPDQNPRRLVAGTLAPRADAVVSAMGYLVTFVTSRYAIDLRIPVRAAEGNRPATWQQGDRVVSIRRTPSPVRLSDAERRDHEAFVRGIARGGELAPVPAEKPPIRSVRVDRFGRLWVQVTAPSVRRSPAVAGAGGLGPVRTDHIWEDPVLYDVFEADGRFVGTVRLPDGAVPMGFERDRVLCFVRSVSDDEHRFVRYRIAWGTGDGQ